MKAADGETTDSGLWLANDRMPCTTWMAYKLFSYGCSMGQGPSASKLEKLLTSLMQAAETMPSNRLSVPSACGKGLFFSFKKKVTILLLSNKMHSRYPVKCRVLKAVLVMNSAVCPPAWLLAECFGQPRSRLCLLTVILYSHPHPGALPLHNFCSPGQWACAFCLYSFGHVGYSLSMESCDM